MQLVYPVKVAVLDFVLKMFQFLLGFHGFSNSEF